MARRTIKIESIQGGISPTLFFSRQQQYHASIGIDPDMPTTDTDTRTSGLIRPTSMEKFSGSTIKDAPMWIVTNPKNNTTFIYAQDGRVHQVTSSLTMGPDLNSGSPLSVASGNGSAYYDNAVYFATDLDVTRFGPLDGATTLDQTFWTSTLSKTALTNTTYPSLRGIQIPNHPMHRHTDNKLFFADVNSNNEGVLHFIRTLKTTVEGDTDDDSTFETLDFPFGVYPTAIESFNFDLAVSVIEGTDTTIRQQNAKIAFWDTTSATFNKITDVEFPDPLITALRNVNGVLYVASGNASGGFRLSAFIGGFTHRELFFWEDSLPPFQGAFDHFLNRAIFGGFTTYPENSASVFAFGSKIREFAQGAHNILRSTSGGANQVVTSLKYIEHADHSIVRPIVGFKDDSDQGLDKISTTYRTNIWRSEVFRIGVPFRIVSLRVPMIQAVSTNTAVTPKFFLDGDTDTGVSTNPAGILDSNFSGKKHAFFNLQTIRGEHSFFLELRWNSTTLTTVALPITIEIDTEDTPTTHG